MVLQAKLAIALYHIHIVEPEHELWERLLFQDYLRQHSDEAVRYAHLKYELAQRYSTDQEADTSSKAEYIETVIQKARQQPAS